MRGPVFGAAGALRETIGVAMWRSNRTDYDRSVAAARALMAEDAFDAAWAEGRAMTLEQAIEHVPGAETDLKRESGPSVVL